MPYVLQLAIVQYLVPELLLFIPHIILWCGTCEVFLNKIKYHRLSGNKAGQPAHAQLCQLSWDKPTWLLTASSPALWTCPLQNSSPVAWFFNIAAVLAGRTLLSKNGMTQMWSIHAFSTQVLCITSIIYFTWLGNPRHATYSSLFQHTLQLWWNTRVKQYKTMVSKMWWTRVVRLSKNSLYNKSNALILHRAVRGTLYLASHKEFQLLHLCCTWHKTMPWMMW